MVVNLTALQASSFLSSMEHRLPSSSKGKRKTAVGASHTVCLQMGPRALHEYQFIPKQPSVRSEALDRVSLSHYLESSSDAPNTKMTSLPSGGRYLHVNDHEGPSYTFQGQNLSADLLTQEGRQQAFPSVSVEYDNSLDGNSFPDPATDAQFGMGEVPGLENPYLSSYRRLDRKRKVCTTR